MKRIRILTLAAILAAVPTVIAQTNTFPDSGNVGIGTTSPGAQLHVIAQSANSGDNSFRISAPNLGPYPSHIHWGLNGDWYIRSANAAGKVILQDVGGNVGIGTTSPQAALDVNGQIVGGFGASATSGIQDWNDLSNTRSGNGYTLLRGYHPNGPVNSGDYFHTMNFEYITKDGSGNVTQLAIPYGNGNSIDSGLHMRGRYSGNWTSWVKILSEDRNGNVGIGTDNPTKKLSVNGTIQAKEVIVETNWSDFVFDDGYELRSLSEVESHIQKHGHLPDVPSAADVQENGLAVAEAQAFMMQKIEELTLYVIDLKKENGALQKRVAELESN